MSRKVNKVGQVINITEVKKVFSASVRDITVPFAIFGVEVTKNDTITCLSIFLENFRGDCSKLVKKTLD